MKEQKTTYKFGKSALSHYVGSDCLRRLRLDLYRNDAARRKDGAPEADKHRMGFELLAAQGHEFERLMFRKLETGFPGMVVSKPPPEGSKDDAIYEAVELKECWDDLRDGKFVIEAKFEIPEAFLVASGIDALAAGKGGMDTSGVRPDVVVGIPPDGRPRRFLSSDGSIGIADAGDRRTGIRIVDVKMSEQPTPGHFVELAFYGMTMASFVEAEGVSDRFLILADAAIWPGGAHASAQSGATDPSSGTHAERMAVFEASLETLPAEVVLPRVVSFLDRDLVKALEGDWRDLPWHIGPACRGCDFLGYRSSKMRRVESEKDLRSRLLYRVDKQTLSDEQIAAMDDRRNVMKIDLGVRDLIAMQEDGIEEIVPGSDDARCWSEAERTGDLSRVLEMKRAPAKRLKELGVEDIRDLSSLPHDHAAFEAHQTLRGARRILVSRAENMLAKSTAEMPIHELRGTSAVMPRSSDVAVYLMTEYDVGSKTSFAFGAKISVNMPTELDRTRGDGTRPILKRTFLKSDPEVFVVHEKSEATEKEVFVRFMTHIRDKVMKAKDDIDEAYGRLTAEINLDGRRTGKGAGAVAPEATIQFYIWDRASRDHLAVVVGRHLEVLKNLDPSGRSAPPFLWMVPPEQLLQDADFVKADSAVTILSDVARTLVAAPLPHHYGLIGLANLYPQKKKEGESYRFSIDTLYFDPLSDQIPSERGHEIWNEIGPLFAGEAAMFEKDPAAKEAKAKSHVEMVETVVKTKLRAMESVRRQLVEDLKGSLTAGAPLISTVFGRIEGLKQVSEDGQVVYQHARLLATVAGLEVDGIVAMPPARREAQGRSIRLVQEIPDVESHVIGMGIAKEPGRTYWAFRTSDGSREAKVSKGDFGWSFLPENAEWQSVGSMKLSSFMKKHSADPRLQDNRPSGVVNNQTTLRRACGVTVEGFDRSKGIVVFSAEGKFLPYLMKERFGLEPNTDGIVAILDPVHTDFFVASKLKPALGRLGVPKIALDAPLIVDDVTRSIRPQGGRRPFGNAAGAPFVWAADAMHAAPSGRRASDVFDQLARLGPHGLNDKQQAAVENAVERRLSVVWGPPGTGKSHTSTALLTGLLLDARRTGRPIRIAVTGPNWTAIDNLASKLPAVLASISAKGIAKFASNTIVRLKSPTGGKAIEELRDHVVVVGGEESGLLLQRLREGNETVVVAGTADQLFRLSTMDGGDEPRVSGPEDELFDFMLVDEASQMDLAHAIVAFAVLARNAQLTVVGDDLQMPPIHPVEAPKNYAHVLGSIYDFYRHYRKDQRGGDGIPRTMLSRNFRSNAPVVDFFRNAGYDGDLTSHHPDMRMELHDADETEDRPPFEMDGNDPLWDVLDPRKPLCALLHSDETSTQSDRREAEVVAALVVRLYGHLKVESDRKAKPGREPMPYGTRFFASGIGVVTPHKAQRTAILEFLDRTMPSHVDREAMASAIDTVERFQGQERTVMIASFGIGDVDQIAAEEEFLFGLRRFNVIASRAKSKLIAIASRKLVEHLPRDPVVLEESFLLKHYFSRSVLPTAVPLDVGGLEDCTFHFRRDPYPA